MWIENDLEDMIIHKVWDSFKEDEDSGDYTNENGEVIGFKELELLALEISDDLSRDNEGFELACKELERLMNIYADKLVRKWLSENDYMKMIRERRI